MQAYPVVVYKDPDSDYGTEVPDLPGCYSAGTTVSEALQQAREAIYAHLEGMAKDAEVAPQASDLSDIRELDNYDDAFTFAAVEIDVSKVSVETARVNIMLPKWLISSIDATEPNLSRFLEESAIKALQEKQRKDVAY